MKFRVFRDVVQCSHIELQQRFRSALPDEGEDGGGTHL
jgi:hypothetical protein